MSDKDRASAILGMSDADRAATLGPIDPKDAA